VSGWILIFTCIHATSRDYPEAVAIITTLEASMGTVEPDARFGFVTKCLSRTILDVICTASYGQWTAGSPEDICSSMDEGWLACMSPS
jgi:hypothetical protein